MLAILFFYLILKNLRHLLLLNIYIIKFKIILHNFRGYKNDKYINN